jgi:hypothetical protein
MRKRIGISMTEEVGESPGALDLSFTAGYGPGWKALYYRLVRLAVDYAERAAPEDSYAVPYLKKLLEPMFELATNMDSPLGTASRREFIVSRLGHDPWLCDAVLRAVGEPPAQGEA